MMNIIRKLDEKYIAVMAMIFASMGVAGFVYEVLFYRIDQGYFSKRGTTFGCWIPIYGFGALGIVLLVQHLKKKSPVRVAAAAALVTGGLEFLTGYVLFHVFGVRLWDYNVEIWNWGNIGGYICFRSVALFAVCGVGIWFLLYPMLEKLYECLKEKGMQKWCFVPGVLFALDILLSLLVRMI